MICQILLLWLQISRSQIKKWPSTRSCQALMRPPRKICIQVAKRNIPSWVSHWRFSDLKQKAVYQTRPAHSCWLFSKTFFQKIMCSPKARTKRRKLFVHWNLNSRRYTLVWMTVCCMAVSTKICVHVAYASTHDTSVGEQRTSTKRMKRSRQESRSRLFGTCL